MYAPFHDEPGVLAVIARPACWHDVTDGMTTTPRERNYMLHLKSRGLSAAVKTFALRYT